MDTLTVLDLLYDGHSCNDCDGQLRCQKFDRICEGWNAASLETLLIMNASREMIRAIDKDIISRIYDEQT